MRLTRRLVAAYLVFLVALLLVASLVGEVAVRARGGRPWDARPAALVVEPGGRLYTKDPALGYTNLPGRYRVTLPTGLSFHTTIDEQGLRVTRPLGRRPKSDAEGVWIFGCSFSYGWSVDDHAAYPWLIQARHREFDIANFSVSGFGTVQSLIQLEQALRIRRRPAIVVLAYASFHDGRNVLTRHRQKFVAPYQHVGIVAQPAARLEAEGGLEIEMRDIVYQPWPGMRFSALVHQAEKLWNQREDSRVDSAAVTDALIERFVALARGSGARVLIATLTRDERSDAVRRRAFSLGAEGVDLAIDLNAPGMRNLPHDGHPSAAAHRRYASLLERAIGSAR